MSSVVHSINVSPGGVPKLPVSEARITTLGLDGDSQRNRLYHGGPMRAVSLYSLERIEALNHEGHSRSRVYARVRRDGIVRLGDPVEATVSVDRE